MLDSVHPSAQAALPDATAPGSGIPPMIFAVVFGFGLGCLAYLLAHVAWLAGIQASLTGVEPKAFWYLSRATAFVGFGLLWLSMVLGLSITNKLARLWPGGPAAADLHEYTSLLGLAFGCLHGLLLTGDGYSKYTLAQVLLPFASTQYRPVWVGLGQFGLYLGLVVTLSFYVRRLISYRWWRLLHFLTFAVFVLVLLHGLFSGSDSAALWVRSLYLTSGLSVLGLTVYRVLVARRVTTHRPSGPTPRAAPNLPLRGQSGQAPISGSGRRIALAAVGTLLQLWHTVLYVATDRPAGLVVSLERKAMGEIARD